MTTSRRDILVTLHDPSMTDAEADAIRESIEAHVWDELGAERAEKIALVDHLGDTVLPEENDDAD